MKQSILLYKHIILALVVIITSLQSCKKAIEIDNPEHLLVNDAVFKDDKTAIAALTGIYSQMMRNRNYIASGASTLYLGLWADEIINNNPDPLYDAFATNTITSANSAISNDIWKAAYSYIYQANACIESINNSSGISAITKNQLVGEAKFIRAFCHFYLLNYFGDVPLITSSDYRINVSMPRTSSEEIYKQIIEDLSESQNLLSATYATSSRVRPNKWTAAALLARVYLYKKDWANAELEATSIINSGSYSLVNSLNDVFIINSNEIIWQLMPVINNQLGNNTNEGFLFVSFSTTSVPRFRLTADLFNAFDSGDLRKSSWVGLNIANGQDYYFPLKYKVRSNFPANPTEYNVVFRLAEQFLIRCEARTQQENLSGAISDLDTIRQRAGLPLISLTDPGISKLELLDKILQERRVELFAEWGHRFLDLKRTGKSDTILGTEKSPNWQSTDNLLPIPFGETQLNPNLIQNSGYQ